MTAWGSYPEQCDTAADMTATIRLILYGSDYNDGDILVDRISKIDKIHLKATDKFEIVEKRTIQDGQIDFALKTVEIFFQESMDRKEYYEFVGLIRDLVIDDKISIPREIFIKSLIALTLSIESKQKFRCGWVHKDEKEIQKDVKEEIKQWLKDQLNDTHYTSDLFMTLTRLKYINNEELPSVECYDKLESINK